MHEPFQLAEVLRRFVDQAGYTSSQLARLSGIPHATITNWLEGRVRKPRQRHNLLKLAALLHLKEPETTELLQAAGHLSVEELIGLGIEEERELLVPWVDVIQHRQQAPFQAIADLPYFVGRRHEIEELKGALLNGRNTAICSLQGMAGVGKTALATHAAYLMQPHFPDGILWARTDKSDTMSILRVFANAYGCDVEAYTDVESRSQVVRELLAHKRALVVLDHVQNSCKVRPLLPPTGACSVIITTRRHDLMITRGVHRIHVKPFNRNENEALALFAKFLNKECMCRESDRLVEIADLLGHLPLALSIVASRLTYEPNWQAAAFLQRLKQARKRLNELTYENQDIRLSFALSYDLLSPKLKHFITALSAFDGRDICAEAIANKMNLSPDEAHDNLRKLYNYSLIRQGRHGSYQLHPLVQEYVKENHQANRDVNGSLK